MNLVRFALAGMVLLVISACAASPVQEVGRACGVYSSMLIQLAPYKWELTQTQRDNVELVKTFVGPVCRGEMPTDADTATTIDNYVDQLEAILLEAKQE